MAKGSNRLVLVHFWTPSCGPCAALEQNVFSQPGVGNAIEAQFVPVKLNADENSATAQWYGINRVPTDVVITPEGQLVGKLISPPTPSGYVSELSAIASKHTSRSGQAFDTALAAAPVQPQINAAYAGLQLQPAALPATAQRPAADPNQTRNSFAGVGAPSAAIGAAAPPINAAAQAPSTGYGGYQPPAAQPTGAPNFAPNNAGTVQPQIVNNTLAGYAANPYVQQPITPIGQAAPQTPPVAQVPPAQVPNQYAAAQPTQAYQQPAAQPVQQPVTQPALAAQQYGAAQGAQPAGAVANPYAAAAQTPAAAVAGAAATAAPAAASVPDLSKMPPGAPPIGFEGYCPVTMRNQWKWIAGDARYGVIHRGRTYWFVSPTEQSQFQTDPDRYTPALSGLDPVLAIDHKQQVAGKRDHSLDFDGMFYMFASEATLQQFTANPHRYAASVRQSMGIPRGRLVR
jgi:protein disulfide-isomerase